MAESNLEVVLKLTDLFGGAAATAATELEKIADKIDGLGEKKSIFAGLQEAANTLDQSLSGVAAKLSALDLGLTGVSTKADRSTSAMRAAKSSVDDMGASSKKAAGDVEATASAVENLGSKAGKIKDVAGEVAEVAKISDKARSSFMSLLGAIDQTQKGNFSPLILGLQSVRDAAAKAKAEMEALNAEMQRLRPGVPVGEVAPNYDYQRDVLGYVRRQNAHEFRNDNAIDARYSPHNAYAQYLTASPPQIALNPGRIFEAEFAEIAAGFKRIQAEARLAAAAAGQIGFGVIGNEPYGPRAGVNPEPLPGDFGRNAIVPYTFVGQAEDAPYRQPDDAIDAKFRNTRASDYFNSGRTFSGEFSTEDGGFSGPSLDDLNAGYAAEDAAEVARLRRIARLKAESVYKQGDRMQSTGMAGLVNGAMLTGMGMPLFGTAMQTEQLDNQNAITARANGANAQAVQFLHNTVHQLAARNGGDYSDVVQSGAAFVSSMTPSADINNKAWQREIAKALNSASQVSVISTAGGAPIGASQTAVATNQAIANLGYDVSTPKKFGEAVDAVTNMLVKMKNVTPSTVPDTLSFLRAVGPVAALNHVAPEDMTGLIYALGKEKMVGSSAGNAMKRLFQRETLPAKKTLEIQELFKQQKYGGFDLSMYDEKGHSRSMLDVLDQVAKADKKDHWSNQTRSQVVGQLSGLYAEPQVGAVLQFMEKNGGKEGLRKQGASIMHGGIEGSGKKNAREAEFEQQQLALANAVQSTTTKIRDAWMQVYKDLEPPLTGMVKWIGNLAEGFGKLPGPVRDTVAVLGIMAGVAVIGAGLFNVFFGNIFKLIGGMRGVGLAAKDGEGALGMMGNAIKKTGWFIEDAVGVVSRFATGITKLNIVGPIIDGMTAAAAAFEAVTGVALLPVIGIAAAIAAAIALLYVGWSHNFLGMRDLTDSAMKAIGGALNTGGKFFSDLSAKAWDATEGIRKAMMGALEAVSSFVSQADSKLGGFGHKLVQVLSDMEADDRKHNEELERRAAGPPGLPGPRVAPAPFNTGFGAPLTAASASPGFGITNLGWVSHKDVAHAGPTLERAAQVAKAKPADHPIDFGSFGQGAGSGDDGGEEIPGLRDDMNQIANPAHKKKAKKPKKGHDDLPVGIGDLDPSEVEKLARQLEDEWKKKGVKITPEFVDLQNTSGQVVDRVFGFKKAFSDAVKDLAPDKGLKQQVVNYIEQAKFFHTGVEQEVTKLEEFLKKAKTQGLKAYIEEQIAAVDKEELSKLGKINSHFKEVHTALYGTDGTKKNPTGGITSQFETTQGSFDQTIKDANKSYEELQETQKGEILTVAQLKERYNLLYTEQKTLTEDQDKMSKNIDDVTQRLAAQDAEFASITGNTRQARQERQALTAQMNSERGTLADMNTQLGVQKAQLDLVTNSMNRANQAYEKAIQDQRTLANVYTEAAQAAKKSTDAQAGNMLATGAKTLYGQITQTSRSGGAISKLITGYVDSYIDSAAGPIAKFLMPGSEKDAQPKPVFDTLGNQKLDTANTKLETANTKLTAASTSMANVDNTTKQMLTGINTLVSQGQVFSGMQQNSDGSMPVNAPDAFANDAGQADMSNSSFGDWGGAASSAAKSKTPFAKTNTGKTLGAVGGALASTIAGTEQGGIGGALTAGIGTLEATGNPIAAGAAAVVGFLHIGSKATPATSPDIYNTQQYGQEEADLLGSGYNKKPQEGANGIYFTEDNATAQATNNMGEIQYIQQWAQTHLNDSDPSIAKTAQNDLAQFGAYNPNATSPDQILHYDKNIGNESVIGGTEAGSYTQIYNDASNAASAIQQLGSASLQAAQNAKSLADSFTANLFGGPSGFSIPYLGSIGGGNASSSFLPVGAIASGTSAGNGGAQGVSVPGSNVQQTVNVRILEGATVNSSDDITQAINNAIPAITNAVNQTNYNTGRYMQGYQSQLA